MKPLRAYLSFGAGVQSTALAVLAMNRDPRLIAALEAEAKLWGWSAPSPLPERFVFADTGDDPASLYPHIDRMSEMAKASGIEFDVVTHKSGLSILEHCEQGLADTIEGVVKGLGNPPYWVGSQDIESQIEEQQGRLKALGLTPEELEVASEALRKTLIDDQKPRITRRQCTSMFKIVPIQKHIRETYKGRGKKCEFTVYEWLGISSDEKQRMKEPTKPKYPWWHVSHPLIHMNWGRGHCIEYLKEQGIEPQRSACVYCPFRSREEWAQVMRDPEDRAKVMRMDDLLRKAADVKFCGVKSEQFLTRDLKPIAEIDFEDDGNQTDIFGWADECGGVCGV